MFKIMVWKQTISCIVACFLAVNYIPRLIWLIWLLNEVPKSPNNSSHSLPKQSVADFNFICRISSPPTRNAGGTLRWQRQRERSSTLVTLHPACYSSLPNRAHWKSCAAPMHEVSWSLQQRTQLAPSVSFDFSVCFSFHSELNTRLAARAAYNLCFETPPLEITSF